jgi:hypothetical protein
MLYATMGQNRIIQPGKASVIFGPIITLMAEPVTRIISLNSAAPATPNWRQIARHQWECTAAIRPNILPQQYE